MSPHVGAQTTARRPQGAFHDGVYLQVSSRTHGIDRGAVWYLRTLP